ncbi:larval cuticle protein LCP-17-like [Uranotaenia lowii]|uniref:larval cuticle protein LCP-17-like n=1 Tax=Uranotaenia lowii TaxID=190385 RepID=UPI002478A96F|nr:larval cuticle protein LCP-17-like [Uranotaenia lowii]
MKSLVILSLFMVIMSTVARPEVMVKTQELDIASDGTFKHNYELDDGTVARAEGDANNVNGFFKYQTPEGENVEITYMADALGYHPQGSHIPAHLTKVLNYIRSTNKL